MIEQDFILLIISCEKYKFKADIQKLTWLKDINHSKKSILYFHVIGNPLLEKEYIIDYSNNTIYIKVEDDYNSLPKKVIKVLKVINYEYKFKYIFKTDDDQQLLNTDFLFNLQNLLFLNCNHEKKRIHYGGQIITINKPYLSQYHTIHPELPPDLPLLQTQYCSGRFYLLSNLAVKYLITNEKEIMKEYLEDYAIGYNLHQTFKLNILELQTKKYFVDF